MMSPKNLLCIFGIKLLFCTAFAQSYKSVVIVKSAYKFELNKFQGVNSTCNEVDEKNKEFLRSVNEPKPCIEVFDMTTGKLKYAIPSPKNLSIGSFTKLTNGQFWIHSSWIEKYILIDRHSKILKELSPAKRNNLELLAVDSKFVPMIVWKNSILSTGLLHFGKNLDVKSDYYRNAGVIREIDFANRTAYLGKVAASGLKNFYGNANNYRMTLNGNKLIVAPTFADEIQIIDLDKGTTVNKDLKNRFSSLIKPMAQIERFAEFSNTQNNEYVGKYHALVGIVYDKHRHIYYRFVRNPMPADFNKITYSMYVLDENFKTLFYSEIPQGYSASDFFITEKGLLMLNKNAYQLNNNLLTFDLFKLNS